MNIGVRAHDIGTLPLVELVKQVQESGCTAVQLAPGKAIAGFSLAPGTFNPGIAYQIGSEFRKRDIQIAILGCYINPIAPNPEERKNSVARFKEYLRYARDLGCSVVATETGSLNADWSFHEGNNRVEVFNEVMEVFRELTIEAEKFGVVVGIEGVVRHVVNTPQKMRNMLDGLNSSNVQVVFDPVNYMDISNYKDQERIITESVQLFGDRIIAVHAKDFVVSADGTSLEIVAPGKGLLNYELILKLLSNKPSLNYLLEDIKPADRQQAMEYLNSQQ